VILILLLSCTGSDAADAAASYGDADLTRAEAVADWSNVATATAASSIPVAIYAAAAFAVVDDDCPVLTETATEYAIDGDCTDSGGTAWSGSMTLTGTGLDTDDSTVDSIVFDALSMEWTEEDCEGAAVEQHYEAAGETVYDQDGFTTVLTFSHQTFDTLDCVLDAGAFAYDYAGSVVQQGTRDTWNGEGTVGVEGQGSVTATTTDEVQDNSVCDSEPLSGTLTLASGGDEAVITFDGATDCDEDATGTWTLNGDGQGELEGVGYQCATAPSRASAWVLALVVGLALGRRRDRAW